MGGYTPGPWAIYRDSFLYGVRRSVDGWSQSICRVDWKIQGNPDGESQANARLIAAAPDLLERLKEARDAIASLPEYALGGENIVRSQDGDIVGHYPIRDELLHHINAAISRATGEGE